MFKLSTQPKLLAKLKKSSVKIVDPESVFLDKNVKIGKGTVLYPNIFLLGKVTFGQKCKIGPMSKLEDCQLGDECKIEMSVVSGSKLGKKVQMGPYSHIRPDCVLGDEVRIGAYAQLKKTKAGVKSRFPHFSYCGDAVVGKNVNYGCGAITANYDGFKKHKTIIEDDVFIGTGVNLVAPLRIKKGAFIAAGSTVVSPVDIPPHSLAISRAKGVYIKENWAKARRGKKGKGEGKK